jgi:hypothetical protein
MAWRVTPDQGRTPEEAPPTPAYYREQASSIRGIAMQTSVTEIKRQLLAIADQYDRLAEHAASRTSHRVDVP